MVNIPRGVRYKFSTGDFALCFEPDTSKAKVLYPAKVVDVSVQRDKGGQRVPAYHIHFQGWKQSWDRLVSESMLLEDTDFNRALMRKAQALARAGRSSAESRGLVDALLKRVQCSQNKGNLADWDALKDPLIDGDSCTVQDDDVGFKMEKTIKTEQEDDDEDAASGADENDVERDKRDSEASSKDEDEDDEKEADVHSAFTPNMDLPPGVRAYLESDYQKCKSADGSLKMEVARPSVCVILEHYLAEFSDRRGPPCNRSHLPLNRATVCAGGDEGVTGGHVSAACTAGDSSLSTCDVTHSTSGTPPPPISIPRGPLAAQYQEADSDVQLCFESISELRVLFDFVLPIRLLCEEERDFCEEKMSSAVDLTWLHHEHHSTIPHPLLPRDTTKLTCAPPSSFLGVSHLLRLLCQLPELLDHLEGLGPASRCIILRHARLLLLYLEDNLHSFLPKSDKKIQARGRRQSVSPSTPKRGRRH